jgi:hypothetical protein
VQTLFLKTQDLLMICVCGIFYTPRVAGEARSMFPAMISLIAQQIVAATHDD